MCRCLCTRELCLPFAVYEVFNGFSEAVSKTRDFLGNRRDSKAAVLSVCASGSLAKLA